MKQTTRRDALDAVSCASAFASDKGRYLTAEDVAAGYAEPVEQQGVGRLRPLEVTSLYPPRRDGAGCGLDNSCIDHPDAVTYPDHVRAVMPDIDAVTMATPPADLEQTILFTIPEGWREAEYVAWLEINVEGDHNSSFSPEIYKTPVSPQGTWDTWAIDYGYPYRGQPSVVYRVPFSMATAATFATETPAGYGDVDGFGPNGGVVYPMDGKITDDPSNPATAGSGADRLRLTAARDYRLQVNVRDMDFCKNHAAPAVPGQVTAALHPDEKHSHEWGQLQFVVPSSQHALDHFEARYSKTPITTDDPATFTRALPILAAQTDSVALVIPVTGAVGSAVDVTFGGMEPLTKYWVAIRAVDACNVPGPYAVSELTTTRIKFTQLSGCFIATAAYGSAWQPQVTALRVFRDAMLPRSALFAAAADLYYRAGPAAAAVIARSDSSRAVVRSLLAPVAAAAGAVAPYLR